MAISGLRQLQREESSVVTMTTEDNRLTVVTDIVTFPNALSEALASQTLTPLERAVLRRLPVQFDNAMAGVRCVSTPGPFDLTSIPREATHLVFLDARSYEAFLLSMDYQRSRALLNELPHLHSALLLLSPTALLRKGNLFVSAAGERRQSVKSKHKEHKKPASAQSSSRGRGPNAKKHRNPKQKRNRLRGAKIQNLTQGTRGAVRLKLTARFYRWWQFWQFYPCYHFYLCHWASSRCPPIS